MSESAQARRSLIRLIWRQPLWAIPFALFFGTVFSADWSGYWLAFKVSLAFSYSIGISLWVLEFFVTPRLPGATGSRLKRIWLREILPYVFASLVGAYGAALIVDMDLPQYFCPIGFERTVEIVEGNPGDPSHDPVEEPRR